MKSNPFPQIRFSALDESAACAITRWRYAPPYDIYNIEEPDEAIQYAIDPQNNFFSMRDDSDQLVGFCSFGDDGQVPGGDYSHAALDIGMGIRPDLTGQGRGAAFVAAVLDFARREYGAEDFRVTIAAFNLRAQRVWEKNGFRPIQIFTRPENPRDFVIMTNANENRKERSAMHNPFQPYQAAPSRYDNMPYRRSGKSGLKLPTVSLGLWHNFGDVDTPDNSRAMLRRAFDLGITHFDLANNYGPPPGSAEENFGRIFAQDFKPYRDELIISTKAGWGMWPGPYGDFGSRKYLVASLDQSLKRMGLDYVDIFYHHRPDPDTPLEETMSALDFIVRSGRALYAGISSYDPEQTRRAAEILNSLGTPCLIHQPSYNMFNRWIEEGLLEVLDQQGIGCIVFSPLAQGLLTNRYLEGIPQDSRAAKPAIFLQEKDITDEYIWKAQRLNAIAQERDQSLAQMAIAWVLRHPGVTSALIGASKVNQVEDNVAAVAHLEFSDTELQAIEKILAE